MTLKQVLSIVRNNMMYKLIRNGETLLWRKMERVVQGSSPPRCTLCTIIGTEEALYIGLAKIDLNDKVYAIVINDETVEIYLRSKNI